MIDEKQLVVSIASGVTITISEDTEALKQHFTALKASRRVKNPNAIDITHSDVVRIADAEGIRIRKGMSDNEAQQVMEIIRQVQSHHMDLAEDAQNDARAVQRLDDIFHPDYAEKVRFRDDIQALAKPSEITKYAEGHFAEIVTDRWTPSPAHKNPNRPIERKVALVMAFLEVVCPDFFSLYRAALNPDDSLQLISAEGGETDENNFRPE